MSVRGKKYEVCFSEQSNSDIPGTEERKILCTNYNSVINYCSNEFAREYSGAEEDDKDNSRTSRARVSDGEASARNRKMTDVRAWGVFWLVCWFDQPENGKRTVD